MTLVFLGLLASIVLYLSTTYAIAWSSSQRDRAAEDRGVAMDAPLSFPTVAEIVRRHSVEWAIGYAVFFTILALADFPFWQRMGIASLLAVIYYFTEVIPNYFKEDHHKEKYPNGWTWEVIRPRYKASNLG